jgi:(1->4)-alpha-D-glucan 1-alpha-D-glucosylmutase
VPSRNDEYLLYQTLIGAWPFEVQAPEDLAGGEFADRIVAYLIKALREAKLETSWAAPDTAYEDGAAQFVRRILDPVGGRAFIADLLPFHAEVARIGAVNGLAQTLLRLTAPGVPDCYQGTELWDLSLVDPDNRRPVDFELRARWLAEPRPAAELLADWQSGRIKQQLIARALAFRRRHPALFSGGDYLPLTPAGAQAERIVAFARRADQLLAVVIVPRLVAPLLRDRDLPLPASAVWADTELELPQPWSRTLLVDELTGRRHPPSSGRLAVAELLAELPVALLSAVPAA